MKKKAIILMAAFTMFSVACKNDLTSLNVNPKKPLAVPSYSLFTYGEHYLANTLTSSNVNLNIFRLIEQQWEETTYTDEANYNIVSRKIPDGIWDRFYTVVLVNLEGAKNAIPTDVTDKIQQQNEIAITDMLEVYTYYYLITTFGNIPYSQALNISKTTFPVFDDATTVYKDLLARLDNDIALLQAGASGASFGSADIIYGGDPSKWSLFGNTFKLKMGITLINSTNSTLSALGKSTVETAASSSIGFFSSNADNAMFKYLASDPNTNPIWVDLVQSQRQDFVACSTIMAFLKPGTEGADPRLPYYFTLSGDGITYAGGDPGANVTFGDNSKPSGSLLVPSSIGSVTNPDFPGDLLDYSETEFNLAEAAAKGFAVTGSAAAHYANAVTASINFWTSGSVSATSYLNAHPIGTTKQAMLNAISFQKYLALYNRGWDAWIETRRTNYPVLVAPETAVSDFPLRFTYPLNEQEINVVNYNAASAAIGGDLVTTPLVFFK